MASVLVVGSRGYVGPLVVLNLMAAGHQVEEIDAHWFRDFSGLPTIPATDVRQWSLGSLKRVPDSIIYLAAVSNDPAGVEYQAATYAINEHAAISLAQEGKRLGVRRFIFASSCSVYGQNGENISTEKHPTNPLTDYAKSKVAAERGLMEVADSGFTVTALRFATACGWSPNLRLDLVLNEFVSTAVRLTRVQVKSDGSPWRPFIHVQDMAEACSWAVSQQKPEPFQLINVGSSEFNHQIWDIARTVGERTGAQITFGGGPGTDQRSYAVDFSLFEKLAPDCKPRHNLQSTIEDLLTRIEMDSAFSGAHLKDRDCSRLPALRKRVDALELDPETLLPKDQMRLGT